VTHCSAKKNDSLRIRVKATPDISQRSLNKIPVDNEMPWLLRTGRFVARQSCFT
jgi:hypothetical protein